jgi:hypothetical protein
MGERNCLAARVVNMFAVYDGEWRVESGLQLLWAFAEHLIDGRGHAQRECLAGVGWQLLSAPLRCHVSPATCRGSVTRHTLRHVLPKLEVACMVLHIQKSNKLIDGFVILRSLLLCSTYMPVCN